MAEKTNNETISRDLFVKYMCRIIDEEGIDYIDRFNSSIEFSEEELAILRQLSIEAFKKYNN